MAGLFDLKPRASVTNDAKIIAKSKSKAKQAATVVKGGGAGLQQRIALAKALVQKHLGKYADDYILIRDEQTLTKYITAAIKNGDIAIDTETTSLEPITTTIAGISIYTPGQKAAYIPINHTSQITGVKVADQLTIDFIKSELLRLVDAKTDIIMFNAKFDMRVLKHQIKLVRAGQNVIDGDYVLKSSFDGYLAAKCLNENEPSSGLKALYTKYVLDGKGDSFAFDDLFKGIPFTLVPINTAYLYAAHDAKVTYELYQFQKRYLDVNDAICKEYELEAVAQVFHEIEMPIIDVIALMEDTGVTIDIAYQRELSEKYHILLEERKQEFYKITDLYEKEINEYKKRNDAVKLDTPINIASPKQLVALLYDILKLKGHKKAPRSTEEKYIKGIDHPIIIALLNVREVEKLLNTYIDKMLDVINPTTGRIHCSFNQYGAVTGRFSSSEPNMQNIPAENKDIRPMFTASEGYVLLSSDYSGQEPRITAHMSRDEKMMKAYMEGRCGYSEIASIAFEVPYEDCVEHYPDGSKYPEGKKRRGKAKAIVLGVCYGKQIKSIAEDLGVPIKVAQEIYDKIMFLFPGLKNFMEDSQQMAIDLGYVDTAFGRKRRLPDMQLPRYQFSYLNGVANDFDPLAAFDEFEDEIGPVMQVDDEVIYEVSQDVQDRFVRLLEKAYGWEKKQKIFEMAKLENLKIVDNSGYIAQAERQCVNSRIQGSAADLTKKAMALVGKNTELKFLGFRLLLQVHDELIGECPKENSARCSEILSACMVEAAKDLVVPMLCDVDVMERWGGKEAA